MHTPENHDPCRRKTYKLEGNSSISDLDNKCTVPSSSSASATAGSGSAAIGAVDSGAVKKMQDGAETEEPSLC